jgi:hypothetical protein
MPIQRDFDLIDTVQTSTEFRVLSGADIIETKDGYSLYPEENGNELVGCMKKL